MTVTPATLLPRQSADRRLPAARPAEPVGPEAFGSAGAMRAVLPQRKQRQQPLGPQRQGDPAPGVFALEPAEDLDMHGVG
jgi:hypothetical protein